MSRTGLIVLLLVLLIVGGLVYLSTIDTERPTSRIEQDITNDALAH